MSEGRLSRPVLATLLLALLWAVGSTWYYDCKIKRVCGPDDSPAATAMAPQPVPAPSPTPAPDTRPATAARAAQASSPLLTVHFGRKSTDLQLPAHADGAVQALRQAAAAGRRIAIVGHSDGRGAPELKARLSAERATILRDWLVARGLPASAIVAVESREDREPVADNRTAAGRAENRRATATLLPE